MLCRSFIDLISVPSVSNLAHSLTLLFDLAHIIHLHTEENSCLVFLIIRISLQEAVIRAVLQLSTQFLRLTGSLGCVTLPLLAVARELAGYPTPSRFIHSNASLTLFFLRATGVIFSKTQGKVGCGMTGASR